MLNNLKEFYPYQKKAYLCISKPQQSNIMEDIERKINDAIEDVRKNGLPHEVVLSRMKTPDGTILESRYTHDYTEYTDKNGETYILDGGRDYVRTSVNKEKAEYIPVYADDDFSVVRTVEKRGTMRDGKMVYVPVCELSDEHLYGILRYNAKQFGKLDDLHSRIICREIVYRNKL